MKVQAEITYILENEPDIFTSHEEIDTRSVYIWQDRRGYLNSNNPWTTFIRSSLNETYESQNGIMEIWSINSDISDPPNQVDDMWIENYKSIQMKTHSIEWHPGSKILRIVWLQNSETIKQKKLIVPIVTLLKQFNLEFPGFPNFHSY